MRENDTVLVLQSFWSGRCWCKWLPFRFLLKGLDGLLECLGRVPLKRQLSAVIGSGGAPHSQRLDSTRNACMRGLRQVPSASSDLPTSTFGPCNLQLNPP